MAARSNGSIDGLIREVHQAGFDQRRHAERAERASRSAGRGADFFSSLTSGRSRSVGP